MMVQPKPLFKIFFVIPIVLWSLSLLGAPARVLAPSAVDSVLTFSAGVLLDLGQEPTDGAIKSAIFEQNKYLLSQFESAQNARFMGGKPLKGGLGIVGLGPIENFEVLAPPVKMKNGRWSVTYKVKQRVLVSKTFLRPGQKKEMEFFLPRDPQKIYVKKMTDQEWPQREYFFYYWRPPYHKQEEPIYHGVDEVLLIKGDVKGMKPSDSGASPQYQKLWRSVDQAGELRIALLLGFDESSKDPDDLGRSSYERFKKYFLSHGFEIEDHLNVPTKPFVDLVKPAENGSPAIRVSLTLSASDTENPIVFSRRAREAFESADIIFYDGHSGLDRNLDLDHLAALSSPDPKHPVPIKFPKKPQILYFDSCAGYYFYSQMYHLAKDGDLDVVTNGLTSDFSTQNRETLAFLDFFINLKRGKFPTWMDILKTVEKAQRCTYLLNVELGRAGP